MIDIKLSLLSQKSPQLCASNQRNGPEPDGRARYDLAMVSRVTWMISQCQNERGEWREARLGWVSLKGGGCDGLRSLGPSKEPDAAEWWGGNWVSKRLSQRGNSSVI